MKMLAVTILYGLWLTLAHSYQLQYGLQSIGTDDEFSSNCTNLTIEGSNKYDFSANSNDIPKISNDTTLCNLKLRNLGLSPLYYKQMMFDLHYCNNIEFTNVAFSCQSCKMRAISQNNAKLNLNPFIWSPIDCTEMKFLDLAFGFIKIRKAFLLFYENRNVVLNNVVISDRQYLKNYTFEKYQRGTLFASFEKNKDISFENVYFNHFLEELNALFLFASNHNSTILNNIFINNYVDHVTPTIKQINDEKESLVKQSLILESSCAKAFRKNYIFYIFNNHNYTIFNNVNVNGNCSKISNNLNSNNLLCQSGIFKIMFICCEFSGNFTIDITNSIFQNFMFDIFRNFITFVDHTQQVISGLQHWNSGNGYGENKRILHLKNVTISNMFTDQLYSNNVSLISIDNGIVIIEDCIFRNNLNFWSMIHCSQSGLFAGVYVIYCIYICAWTK